MISSILRGKSREEITSDFLNAYHIPSSEWKKFNKEMKKIKIPEFNVSKHIVLVWAIPLAMFGLTLLISLLVAGMGFDEAAAFPRIFKVEHPDFFQRMVNVGEGIFLIFIAILFIILPLKSIAKTYDW